ncbi:MAG: hypothetical protein ACTSRL_22345 [Candidatus Helarchaeota archaeon]
MFDKMRFVKSMAHLAIDFVNKHVNAKLSNEIYKPSLHEAARAARKVEREFKYRPKLQKIVIAYSRFINRPQGLQGSWGIVIDRDGSITFKRIYGKWGCVWTWAQLLGEE